MKSTKGVAALLIVAISIVAFMQPAAAHETEQPYAYLFVGESTLDGRLELSVNDVGEVLGIDVSGTDAEIEANLRQATDALTAYAGQTFAIAGPDGEYDIEWGRVDLFRENSTLAFAVVQYTAVVADGSVPANLDVRFEPFLDEIDGRDGLLLVNGGFENGEYLRDREKLQTFTTDSRTQGVDLEVDSGWDTVKSGITLGIDHIRTGPDHILFVLALLLPSVLVFRDGWEPSQGFRSSLWRVLKIATFFTIAHSITFTLAGLDLIPLPPSKLVETIIAASIAGAALHNLKPIWPNREWALAFVFGLFHGMGFASLVNTLDVSKTSQLLSLLGRNIGIEIGQVVVILILFPALYLLRRTSAYDVVLKAGSILLSALAIGWMIERIWETDLGTNAVVESFASSPNGYIVSAVATAIAAAIYFRARERDELIPLS